MNEDDLERYETDVELQIYREYRDVLPMFSYVVETERRFYLANGVDVHTRDSGGSVFFELELEDAWVWDMYRPARFLKNVRVLTFRDVNVEALEHPEMDLSSESVTADSADAPKPAFDQGPQAGIAPKDSLSESERTDSDQPTHDES